LQFSANILHYSGDEYNIIAGNNIRHHLIAFPERLSHRDNKRKSLASRTMTHSLTLPTAVLVLVTTVTNKSRSSCFHVDGFSTLSGVPSFRTSAASKIDLTLHTNNAKRETTVLFGILDDIMEEDNADDQEQSNEDSDEQLTELYYSIIFSSDLQFAISKRLDECTDPLFLAYLNASSESSEDEEERQGLTELIDQIDGVKTKMAIQAAEDQEKAVLAAKAKEDAEKEASETAAAAAATTESKKPMTNADVLRKAGEIDAGIALSDEDKPSDFISDCREVVNLSRGFNDSGKMSVGGR